MEDVPSEAPVAPADPLSKFIARNEELSPLLQSQSESIDDSWAVNEFAPGHQLSDYQPLGGNEVAPGHKLSDYQPLDQLSRATDDSALLNSPSHPAQSTGHIADSVDPNAEVGVCGLANIGNTCYMNAGLQCIRSIPQIVQHYYTSSPNTYLLSTENKMTVCRAQVDATFTTLVKKLWSGKFSSVHPDVFKSALGLLYPQFSGSRQHDCQEFLAMLLDSLHEHLSSPVDQTPTPSGTVDQTPTLPGTVDQTPSPPGTVNQAPTPPGTVDQTPTPSGTVDQTPSLPETVDQTPTPPGTVDQTPTPSVISDTFQGQLRNEVECSVCGNVSTKVEPFVYLSLSLPGAYDKFIELFYVSPELPPTVTRLAVKVYRYGSTVEDIKKSLGQLLGRVIPSDLLVLAEVLAWTVVRTLAGTLPISSVSSKRGEHLYMFEMIPADKLVASLRMDTDPWAAPSANQDIAASNNLDLFGAEAFISGDPPVDTDEPHVDTMETEDTPPITAPSAVFMEWHSCSICLEEMLDSDLLTHAECGGKVCGECLTSSKAHQESSGQKRISCPICSKPLSEENGFIKAVPDGQQTDPSTISLLLVTVLFQSSEGLICRPLLRHLPTNSLGALFYREVTKVIHPSLHSLAFTLRLTDDKGRWCSRCHFTSHCTGCAISRSTGAVVDIRPGDHLTVQFSTPLQQDHINTLSCSVDDPSLSELLSHPLSLQDCLRAFSQREMLTSDNSWYCPSCEGQRSAERTLTVDKLPQTLIIHLKRFIYHGREGNKVEGPVIFPLELRAEEVCRTDSTHLQLMAFVCHSGTLQYGHYTAYSKLPTTQEWVYYNDSSTSKVSGPSEDDARAAYILFYQKPATLPTIDRSEDDFDDSIERVSMETILKRFQTPCPQLPPPPLRKHNSNPDLTLEVKVQTNPSVGQVSKPTSISVCPW